jgi:hypothetical protein
VSAVGLVADPGAGGMRALLDLAVILRRHGVEVDVLEILAEFFAELRVR